MILAMYLRIQSNLQNNKHLRDLINYRYYYLASKINIQFLIEFLFIIFSRNYGKKSSYTVDNLRSIIGQRINNTYSG